MYRIVWESKDRREIIFFDRHSFTITIQNKCFRSDGEWTDSIKGHIEPHELEIIRELFSQKPAPCELASGKETIVDHGPEPIISRDRYIVLSYDALVVLREIYMIEDHVWSSHDAFVVTRDEYETMEELIKKYTEENEDEDK